MRNVHASDRLRLLFDDYQGFLYELLLLSTEVSDPPVHIMPTNGGVR